MSDFINFFVFGFLAREVGHAYNFVPKIPSNIPFSKFDFSKILYHSYFNCDMYVCVTTKMTQLFFGTMQK
jgi:hypothetical protein